MLKKEKILKEITQYVDNVSGSWCIYPYPNNKYFALSIELEEAKKFYNLIKDKLIFIKTEECELSDCEGIICKDDIYRTTFASKKNLLIRVCYYGFKDTIFNEEKKYHIEYCINQNLLEELLGTEFDKYIIDND